MSVFLSQARGALMGLAVGDTVGTTNEFKWVDAFGPITDIVGGRSFLLKPGQWTDGTSMTLCIAGPLLAQGHYDLFNVMNRYQRWFSEDYRSSTDRCFDVGSQVCAVLLGFEHDPRVPVIAERTISVGNGVIICLAPMMIAGFRSRSPREVVATAHLSARKTHFSVEAEAATKVFAALLAGALPG